MTAGTLTRSRSKLGKRPGLTPDRVPKNRSGDVAHIVKLPEGLPEEATPQGHILEAMIEALEVEALCGYRWIPSKDPKRLPLCQKCRELYEAAAAGEELPDA